MSGTSSEGPQGTTRVGSLLGPHGVQGGIKIFLIGDAAQVAALGRVYVQGKGWLKVRRSEPLAPGLVLHLAGITSREGAEALRGLQVYAADSEIPPLDEGEYYYHDLRGLSVQDEDGTKLGQVTDILDMGHQDLLVVDDGQSESFVPLQAPYVVVKSVGGRPTQIVLTADAPEGLIGPDPDDHEPAQPSED